MRRILSTCCARAASGKALETTIPVRRSRRRIAGSLPRDYADDSFQRFNHSRVLRPAEWGPTVILRSNNPQDRMSALGQKQTWQLILRMSPLPPKADIG